MLGYDRFFHFWGCVGVSLSSHRKPGRQLAEGTGTCHPVALNTAHTLPLQGSLKVAGLFYPALGSIQSRGRISLTFMYDKRPKLLALLNQA